jgi:hypothetical protein
MKSDVHAEINKIRRKLKTKNSEGLIIISKDQAYFMENERTVEITLPVRDETTNNVEKYLNDLAHQESDILQDINYPFNESDELMEKVRKVMYQLQQRRVNRDRIKSLINYYILGEITTEDDGKCLNMLQLSRNQAKKLRLKSNRTYNLFRNIGITKALGTKYISVSAIAEMSKEQYDQLVEQVKISQELESREEGSVRSLELFDMAQLEDDNYFSFLY